MESNYFVIVIGSGAAGIAAAKYLHSLGKSYIVLEAMDRIGGRVWTKESPVNLFPIELGGEFLHGSQIVTNYISQTYDYSLSYAPRFLPQHMWWSGNDGQQCFSLIDERNKNERTLLQRLEADVDELISINQSKMAFNIDNIDMSLEDYLISKGYSETEIEKANIVFAQTNCIHISELSVRELTRDSIVDRSGPGEFRVNEGMQTILKNYSKLLNIALNKEVKKIIWKKNRCLVVTSDKQKYYSEKVLITIPIAILQKNITTLFEPPLPQSKIESILDFNIKPATKLFFIFTKLFWDKSMIYMCNLGPLARWWTPYYGRETPKNEFCITCYITADRAEYVDALSEIEVIDLGLQELSRLLHVNINELKKEFLTFTRQSWAKEKYIGGGYASPKVGTQDCSYKYSLPIENTLYFAGEASAYHSNTQTIHGAFDSGVRAACEILDLYHSRF